MTENFDHLPSITNARLATLLEQAMAEWHMATKAVFELAEHGQERFLTVLTRIGHAHPVGARFQKADAARTALEAEARSRVGELGLGGDYPYTLRKSPRYVRVPRAKAA